MVWIQNLTYFFMDRGDTCYSFGPRNDVAMSLVEVPWGAGWLRDPAAQRSGLLCHRRWVTDKPRGMQTREYRSAVSFKTKYRQVT